MISEVVLIKSMKEVVKWGQAEKLQGRSANNLLKTQFIVAILGWRKRRLLFGRFDMFLEIVFSEVT